ncbi:MAG: hypothetical protein R2791_14880 [Saprospiraceae bacterium]
MGSSKKENHEKYPFCFCPGFSVRQSDMGQIQNKGAFINITPGSSVIALDGVVNTDGGTLTVEGTLRTPAI